MVDFEKLEKIEIEKSKNRLNILGIHGSGRSKKSVAKCVNNTKCKTGRMKKMTMDVNSTEWKERIANLRSKARS